MSSPWIVFTSLSHLFLLLLCFVPTSRSLMGSSLSLFIAEELGSEGLLTGWPCLGLWLSTFFVVDSIHRPNTDIDHQELHYFSLSEFVSGFVSKNELSIAVFFLICTVGYSTREHYGFCFLQRFKDLIYSCNKFFYSLAFCVFSIHSLMAIDILWGKHHKEFTLKTIRTQRWVQQYCKLQTPYMKMNYASISFD